MTETGDWNDKDRTVRFACKCWHPGHVVDVNIEKWGDKEVHVSLDFHHYLQLLGFWTRVKMAFQMLYRHEVLLDCVAIKEEDLPQLRELLQWATEEKEEK